MLSCKNYIHMWKWKWNSHGHQNSPIFRQYIYGKIERNLLLGAPCKLLSCLQFIDDIEMNWVENPDCPNDSTTFANSFNNSISHRWHIYTQKRILEYNLNSERWRNNIQSPYETHWFSPLSQAIELPPSPYLRRIPRGLTTRIRRICSSVEIFED